MRKESKKAKIRSLKKSASRRNAINSARYTPRGGTRL